MVLQPFALAELRRLFMQANEDKSFLVLFFKKGLLAWLS